MATLRDPEMGSVAKVIDVLRNGGINGKDELERAQHW